MSVDDSHQLAEETRRRKLHWSRVAQAAERLSPSRGGFRYGEKSEAWRAIGERFGMSPNTIQRHVQTRAKLQSIQEAIASELADIPSFKPDRPDSLARAIDSFAKAEKVVRLYGRDVTAGVVAIRRLLLSNMTVGELDDELANSSATAGPRHWPRALMSSTDARRVASHDGVLATLEDNAAALYGSMLVHFYFARYNFEDTSTDIVAIRWKYGALEQMDVDAIVTLGERDQLQGVALSFNGETDTARRLIEKVQTQAQHFRLVWLCITDSDSWSVDTLAASLDRLDLTNVGIVEFVDSAAIRIHRRPNASDRTEKHKRIVEGVIRQGIPDYGVA